MAATWLTQGLDWWNRHRRWSIRERIFTLPPHPVTTEAGTRIVVPCAAEDDVPDAAWTARSFLHRLDRAPAGRLALDLYLDSPDPELRSRVADRWTPLFQGSEVSSAWEAIERLAPIMPTLDRLAVNSAAVRRLAVVLGTQEEYNVILVDPGVVLFGNSAEFADALHDGKTTLYLQHTEPIDDPTGETERDNGASPLPPADRAVLALLLGAHGARALPPERYLASDQGQFSHEPDANYARLTARRFTPATRHLLYEQGLPRLWRQWQTG